MQEHMAGIITPSFRFYYGTESILNGTTTNFTTASVNQALVGLTPAANTYIQFRNTSNDTISGGKTSYITLKESPEMNGIASVSLGEQSYISGSGYIGASDYSLNGNGNENNGTSVNSHSELLLDINNEWYLGVTPSSSYNAVRLNVTLPQSELSVARSVSVRIYNAFHEAPGDACSIYGRFTTPGEVTGISVNLLNLNEAIANPHYVLNNNPDQYAAYLSGELEINVNTSISQTIVYDHKASVTDGINVKLALNNDLIGLDVFSTDAIYIYAYDGPNSTPSWEGSLADVAQLLDLDLLDLINLGGSHGTLEFTVNPGVQFDRIKIQFNPGLIDVGVIGDALRLYHIKLAPAAPTITGQPTNQEICAGENVTFTASATTPSGAITGYQWQYHNGSSWVNAPGESDTESYTITNVPQTHTGRIYRVAITGGQPGCEQTVYSSGAELSVIPVPGRAHVNFTEANN